MTWAERLFPKSFKSARASIADDAARILKESLDTARKASEDTTPNGRRLVAAMPSTGYGSWSRSSGGKFPGGTSSPFAGINFNNWQLRQQARDIVSDSPEAGAIVGRWADLVVDLGLRVVPEPNLSMLGLTPEQGQTWSENVEARFDLWCSSKMQHRAGLFTFYQIQHLVQKYFERDNDWFFRLYYNADRGLLNALQFELIDTNQIRGDAITSTILIGRFNDGIERGPDGREELYHVWVQGNGNNATYEAQDIPRVGPGGKLNMLHGFVPEYAGQARGLSPFASTLQEFELLEDHRLAESIKNINLASINMYVKPAKDAPASNIFDQIGNQGAGPSTIVAGGPGTPSGVGATAVNTQPSVTYTPIEEASVKQPGIGVFNLDAGEDLVPFENHVGAMDFAAFQETVVSVLAARHGMPYEYLMMKFASNYSASRGAIVLLYRGALMKRDRMDSDLISPVYEMWLSGEIASGSVSCPGWQDPRLRAAWLGHRLNGAPMINIDPNQTAKADQLLVEMGAKTLDDVARETNGSSGKANRAANTRQFAELPASPFNQPGNAPPGDAPAPGQPTDVPSANSPAKKKPTTQGMPTK